MLETTHPRPMLDIFLSREDDRHSRSWVGMGIACHKCLFSQRDLAALSLEWSSRHPPTESSFRVLQHHTKFVQQVWPSGLSKRFFATVKWRCIASVCSSLKRGFTRGPLIFMRIQEPHEDTRLMPSLLSLIEGLQFGSISKQSLL